MYFFILGGSPTEEVSSRNLQQQKKLWNNSPAGGNIDHPELLGDKGEVDRLESFT